MTGSNLFGTLSGTSLPDKQTRIAIGLAVAVHLSTLLMAILSPYLVHRRPILPEIYTVNLVAVSEPASAPAPRPRPAKPSRVVEPVKEKAPPPRPAPAVKAPAPTPAPVPTPAPKATPQPAVSLRPIKKKTQSDLKAVESIREKLQSQQKAEKAQQKAEKAVSSALTAIRQSLHSQPRPTVSSAGVVTEQAPAAGGPSGGAVVDEARRQYFAAVYERIREHFVLPDLKNWKPSLQAILVIEVRKDGVVGRSYFEQKSENPCFNQAVQKALTDAAPLPPFPPELTESRLEFGLRFRPGDLM